MAALSDEALIAEMRILVPMTGNYFTDRRLKHLFLEWEHRKKEREKLAKREESKS